MDFNTLSSILSEGHLTSQYPRLRPNPNPVIIKVSDILRDPEDETKGVRTYLDKFVDDGESELVPSRARNRVLWVINKALSDFNGEVIDLQRLYEYVTERLKKWLIMHTEDEDAYKTSFMSVAKEAAFITRLMLPQSDENPRGRGVFTSASRKQDTGAITPALDDLIYAYASSYDPVLINNIKNIVGTNGVSFRRLMSELQKYGGYSEENIKRVLKSLRDIGTIERIDGGKFRLVPQSMQKWRRGIEAARSKPAHVNPQDVAQFAAGKFEDELSGIINTVRKEDDTDEYVNTDTTPEEDRIDTDSADELTGRRHNTRKDDDDPENLGFLD